ncbi:hypothetical protein [Salipaludibacillus agaradhaerens]|nr:hypothetical protein [Salipaludibacillus agaradhaerens]
MDSVCAILFDILSIITFKPHGKLTFFKVTILLFIIKNSLQ